MKKLSVYAMVWVMLFAALGYGTALAGTAGWPCRKCYDTTMGYEYVVDSDGSHEMNCLSCHDSRLIACYGGTATCIQRPICLDCEREYGETTGHTPGAEATCTTGQICDVCKLMLSPATGHNYVGNVAKPTCTKQDCTVYTCTLCSDSYTGDYVNAVGHWYGLWMPNEGSTHSAECRRCGYSHTTDCTPVFEVKLTKDSAAINVCPVCGSGAYETITEAKATGSTFPKRGELCVMYAPEQGFIITWEYFGGIVPITAPITVSIPVEIEGDFTIAESEFTYEEGILTLTIEKETMLTIIR